jgi:hypothetical protein
VIWFGGLVHIHVATSGDGGEEPQSLATDSSDHDSAVMAGRCRGDKISDRASENEDKCHRPLVCQKNSYSCHQLFLLGGYKSEPSQPKYF